MEQNFFELSETIEANCLATVSLLRLIGSACDADSPALCNEDLGNVCDVLVDFVEKVRACSVDICQKATRLEKDARLMVGLSEMQSFSAVPGSV